jgi:hypothetical protein
VNDTGEFQALGDAVLYNALAWVVTGNDAYASNAASFVNVWFLDPDTAMAPNLDFAQGVRGPGGSNGTHTGVLYVPCDSFYKWSCADEGNAPGI